MKAEEQWMDVKHGTPVLVRNQRNEPWLLRVADKIDSSWMNEIRLLTTEGETWKRWLLYDPNQSLEGTTLPHGGIYGFATGDACVYIDEECVQRLGFFVGMERKDNAEIATICTVPLAVFREGTNAGKLVQVLSSSIRCIEKEWPHWARKMYIEPYNENPYNSRWVPV